MPRRLLFRVLGGVAVVFALAVAVVTALLIHAHLQIRRFAPELPAIDALRAVAESAELPTRVSYWNTMSQATPRAQVLEPSLDPAAATPYVMAHPAFLLEWADGRALLIDAGMDRAQAASFGRPIEWAGGAPAQPHAPIAERLAPALAGRPLAIAFTHLHADHVGGVVALCDALPADTRVRLFQTPVQMDVANFTTWPARTELERAPCLARERLADDVVAPLPGYPGAFAIHAAGHTPGSQILGAFVRDASGVRGILFAGDAANAIDGIRLDVPKPRAYQRFLVPESEPRLVAVRALLREAEAAGFTIAISHDEQHLATTGIPVYGN